MERGMQNAERLYCETVVVRNAVMRRDGGARNSNAMQKRAVSGSVDSRA